MRSKHGHERSYGPEQKKSLSLMIAFWKLYAWCISKESWALKDIHMWQTFFCSEPYDFSRTWFDLYWPFDLKKVRIISILKLMHDVYQKKAEHPRISFVTTFFFCALPYDLSWPWLDLSWPFWTLKIEKLKINWI